LPMNTRAVVQVTGTVTMRDDLIHPIVHAALGRPGAPSWVAQERFEPHYYPALQPDGSSLWPQRWSVAELEAMRAADPLGFSLNYQNDPTDTTGATWWTPEIFRRDETFPTVQRVIHIDGATTKRKKSDLTVLAMVGRDASGLRACVERVDWGRWDIMETRAKVHEFCQPLRIKPSVRIEGNQGGDTWLDSLAPWPVGVEAEVVYTQIPKDMRIKRGHEHYRRRAVVHAWEMPELEAELCAWPNGRHDDVADAVAGALQWAFA
jgi:phage terminase large subunit-like protein